ncbi:hypothetical protein IFU20_21765 [Pseudomonas viridiflava]|uniref:hypothetical protein n=1 Tax=Pseudomonas viridiflava TaxID=33069 RepID=UPI00177B4408|nr:hypothetical protein [Pseudomonas viridiflava]MBD8188811.1 hypothetical protein [Pseudomonas viridiflava]
MEFWRYMMYFLRLNYANGWHMKISDDLVELATSDPVAGLLQVLDYVQDSLSRESEYNTTDYALLLEVYALISSIREADLIYFERSEPTILGDLGAVCGIIWKYFVAVRGELEAMATSAKLASLKRRFTAVIENEFEYTFTDGDLTRIQEVVNELRDMLVSDTQFDEGHKRRLLKRLEALQSELHKSVGDLSHFYNLMGDFGVATGKLGKDAKPFTDRIKELISFAWKAQARAEELPSSAENPMLENEEEPTALI